MQPQWGTVRVFVRISECITTYGCDCNKSSRKGFSRYRIQRVQALYPMTTSLTQVVIDSYNYEKTGDQLAAMTFSRKHCSPPASR
jgi:hypothetical protein